MKKLIFAILVLFSMTSMAQLAATKSEIIAKYGYNYESGIADDGSPYIYYEREMETSQSGAYTQIRAMYFFTTEEGDVLCYMWKVFEPDTETNSNVLYYNNQYVKIGNMKWKDYRTGVVYSMDVNDGLCIITAWLETND